MRHEPGTDVPERGPDEALRELYVAHGTAILTFLVRLTRGDQHQAEDILQETLIRAWRHPEARRANGEWSRPWLFTVAQRIAIDQFRAAAARPPAHGDDRLEEQAEPVDGYQRLIDRQEVRAAIAQLPQRLRDVLIEVYYREHTVAQAAELLGVPPGTVKSRTFYAVRALRELLVERGYLNSGRTGPPGP